MIIIDKIRSFFHQRKLKSGIDIGECDPDVYNNGTVVAVFGNLHRDIITAWFKIISKESGQKVDWCFSCGRYVVKAVGDLKKIDDAAFCFGSGRVRYMEDQSWYGYHPGGQNHWSLER